MADDQDFPVDMNSEELKSLPNLKTIVTEVQKNFSCLYQEFEQLKEACHVAEKRIEVGLPPEMIVISKRDLDRLNKEVRMLKQALPSLINKDLCNAYSKLLSNDDELAAQRAELSIAQSAMEALREELACVVSERDHWKSRWEAASTELLSEREEKLDVQCQLRESAQQLSQQSEFCASMGSASATLLWRVTRSDDNIQAILVGAKVDEFLSLVGSTVLSFCRIYTTTSRDELTSSEPDQEEMEFVFALIGIITNIAASPYGRDFLTKNTTGLALFDTFLNVLRDLPVKKCSRLKTLIVMSLYNLSINQKGLKLLCSQSGFITLLVWTVKEESDIETRLNCLRLVLSLLCDEDVRSTSVWHEANESLTPEFLQTLNKDRCEDIRMATIDLMSVIRNINKEK